jgi:hypothetical protein
MIHKLIESPILFLNELLHNMKNINWVFPQKETLTLKAIPVMVKR